MQNVTIPTMQELAGLGDDQVRNPYWLHTGTGEIFQTERHHGREFAITPELVGFTHEEIDQLPYDKHTDRRMWTIGFTNLMLARGWARIDLTSPTTFAVMAGGLDWAHIAIQRAATMTEAPADGLVAFVIVANGEGTTDEAFQRFSLIGDDARIAIDFGLERWARASLSDKQWSRSTRGMVPDQPSRMKADDQALVARLDPDTLAAIVATKQRHGGTCPYGFGAR